MSEGSSVKPTMRAGLRRAKPSVARAARAVACRSEQLAHRLEPREIDRPALPVADADGRVLYRNLWMPPNVETAKLAILNTADEALFEKTAAEVATQLGPFIDSGDIVADVGCGIGRIVGKVASACREIWAIDVSEEMLTFAADRLRGLGNVKYAPSEGTRVPSVPDANVDFVYSVLVLQHLEREDCFLLLRDMHRFTRPDGRGYFTFPNLLTHEGLAMFLRRIDRGEIGHAARARSYTPQEVERLLPTAGWEILDRLDDERDIVVSCRRV